MPAASGLHQAVRRRHQPAGGGLGHRQVGRGRGEDGQPGAVRADRHLPQAGEEGHREQAAVRRREAHAQAVPGRLRGPAHVRDRRVLRGGGRDQLRAAAVRRRRGARRLHKRLRVHGLDKGQHGGLRRRHRDYQGYKSIKES